MRRTVHKAFLVWNFDKEEKWLNEMAAKGLCLVSVGFCKYEFEDCEPGEYKICLQLLENLPNDPESRKYVEFLESTGAEHVGSYMRWVYFRKKTASGEFELFSDNASRVKYLSTVINFIAALTIANLLAGISNVLLIGMGMEVTPINYLGFLNIALAVWGAIGNMRLIKKRKKMKQDSQLYE